MDGLTYMDGGCNKQSYYNFYSTFENSRVSAHSIFKLIVKYKKLNKKIIISNYNNYIVFRGFIITKSFFFTKESKSPIITKS